MESEAKKSLNILIVEDDLGDRKFLQQLLSTSALSVSDVKFAGRLDEAQELLEKEDIDVVFLDLGLPDSKGIDSCSAVNEKAPGVPIIVLSGLDDEETAVEVVKKGAQDYLVKGYVDKNLLTRTVRYAIERKRTQEILDQKQRNIESIFDATPVGMMLVDEHMVIRRVNDAIRQMLNKDFKQIINQRVGDSLGCINTVTSGKGCGNNPACGACRLHKALETVLDSRQPVHEVEIKPTLKIDDVRISRWFRISAEPAIIDGHVHAVIAMNDITDSKTAQRERQLAEDKYKTIFENSAVAISLVDEQERLISWNKFMESLLGMTEEDLYLKPIKSLYPEGQWKEIRNHNVRQKGMQHHLETKMVKNNGDLIDVDVSLSVLKNPEGKVIGSIGVITDITERKRAEEELKQTMAMKSQFISTVSHELRTPMTSMKEAITIVSDEVAGKINKDQRHFLDIAKRNIERLSRLINEVLDFQKLSADKMKFYMNENDIAAIVKDACHTMLPHAKKKDVQLSVEVDDDLPKIEFDSDKIIQVVTNLVSNAVKFTPEKGKVSVSVGRRDEDIFLRISDTGMGMPKEALSRIFDQFYQVHKPAQQIKGTGLGLAIVKKVVEVHGGRIEVESELGKGTTFTVFLPLNRQKEQELPVESDELVENALVEN